MAETLVGIAIFAIFVIPIILEKRKMDKDGWRESEREEYIASGFKKKSEVEAEKRVAAQQFDDMR